MLEEIIDVYILVRRTFGAMRKVNRVVGGRFGEKRRMLGSAMKVSGDSQWIETRLFSIPIEQSKRAR